MVGFVVIRDAPGNPESFFGDLLNFTSCANDTVSINTTIPAMACDIMPYNFTANFPSCSEMLDCVTVDCVYGDSEPENLAAICDPGFLALVNNKTRCDYGLLNSFQVQRCIDHLIGKNLFPFRNLLV